MTATGQSAVLGLTSLRASAPSPDANMHLADVGDLQRRRRSRWPAISVR